MRNPFITAATLAFALAGFSVSATRLQPEKDRSSLEEVESDMDGLHSKVRDLDSKLDRVESGVHDLKSKLEEKAGAAALFFFVGAFCALWAQNTGRSAWGWFFLGILFNVITVIVLLAKNSRDVRSR